MSRDTDTMVAGLRRWARTHDLTTKAAVELLVTHGLWLRRPEFRDLLHHDRVAGDCWISWREAREAFDRNAFVRASSTEIAVLDLAIALGEDRYRFNRMGGGTAAVVSAAVEVALGGVR
jgi:hypothetical protein